MKITVCPCVNGGITHASVQPTVNQSHSQTSPISREGWLIHYVNEVRWTQDRQTYSVTSWFECSTAM